MEIDFFFWLQGILNRLHRPLVPASGSIKNNVMFKKEMAGRGKKMVSVFFFHRIIDRPWRQK
jgi:hypothetical protein